MTLRRSRQRRLRLAALGAALLALGGGGIGLVRWRAASWRARPAVTAPPQDPAEARLQLAASGRPGDPAAWLELGRYEEDHARPFEALCDYAEAQHLKPGDAALPARLASALQTGHIVDVARTQLLAALRTRPEDLQIRRRLAELYLTTAQPQQARSVMEARRAAVWQDAEAVVMLGRTLQACGDSAGAAGAFRRSLSLQPQQAEAYYRLGRLYLSLRETELARDALFHAMSADRSHPEYPFYTGMTFLQQPRPGDADRAVIFLKDALALKPSYSEADDEYGVALERLGRRPEALTRYTRAMLDDLENPDPNRALGRGFAAAGDPINAHRYMGRYYDLKDRPVEAAREFRAMAAAAPKDAKPVLLEGQIYLRTQQEARAVAVTEAALKRLPHDPQLLERLAVLKINRGDRPYARRVLHHWLELQTTASRPLWLLGRCDFGDLNYAGGIAWLEKAVAKQPFNATYLGFLGGGLLKLGTPDSCHRAADVLARAVTQEPDNAEYHDLYAQSLQRLGRDEEAQRQYLQALDADPYRIACYTPVAQLAWRLRRPGAAAFFPPVIRAVQQRLSEEMVLWRRVWDHPEDADGHLKLAQFLCRTASLTRARSQLEQALELRPNGPAARELLATVRRVQEAL